MSTSASEAKDTASGRLGGARADFVASLGRKISDAREVLVALEDDPSSKPPRDELRRRLHALGSGARLLRFEAMARSLQEVLAVLDRSAQSGGLRDQEVAFIGQVLDDLPALAWGETPPREASMRPGDEAWTPSGVPPIAVLVVGDESLADGLTADGPVRTRAFECDRAGDVQSALQIARAFAPDLVLLDADIAQASSLVEALLDDPLTEPVPVVVVGTFAPADEAARFVALGVAKTLTKSAGAAAIRTACDEVLDTRESHVARVTLGEPTLEQLADRLAQELKGALVETVDRTARSYRVPLGEGTEVLGALWGAIARVQEIVSQRTKGAIRFGGDTPEGAIALAPWLHQDLPGTDRGTGRGRGAAADVRLTGRRVVVADDDPGVTWFIADLLRTAGCEVHEALDGTTALNLAFALQPELIVSDILMPGLDGFALCRALRRDVALRDTPVMLLSWKEDLLQRVRELGASAAAYMRKESDSRAVLARVREVLRPRARIEMRLRGDGEVRGRLDDLSPRLLLELVCQIRKDARVAVRDATFLYEIDVRGGAPRKATLTASDGSYKSGDRALAMLLGVGAGRFSVSSSTEPIRGELSGTLFDLLKKPVAAARGALAATTGPRTVDVERIVLDSEIIDEYLRATPEATRAVIRRLAEGEAPRKILLAGQAAPNLLEDILSDLAARCAIRGVEGLDGRDLLTPAVDAALTALTEAPPSRRSLPPNARISIPARPLTTSSVASPPATASAASPSKSSLTSPSPTASSAAAPSPAASSAVSPSLATTVSSPASPAASAPARVAAPASPAASPKGPEPEQLLQLSSPWPMAPSSPPPSASMPRALPPLGLPDDDGPPSSLEDAVIREISDRSPDPPRAARERTPHTVVAGRDTPEADETVQGGLDLPPIVDTSQLRARSSNPPPNHEREPGDETFLPSIPPDAIVPAATSNEEFAVVPATAAELPAAEDREEAPAHQEEEARPEPLRRAASERRLVIVSDDDSPLPPPDGSYGEAPEEQTANAGEISTVDSAASTAPPARRDEVQAGRSGPSMLVIIFALALVAGVFLIALRIGRSHDDAPRPTTTQPAVLPPTAASPPVNTAPIPGTSTTEDPSGAVNIPPGFGLLEIVAPAGARVRVDGVEAGQGPLAASMQRPGYHQVRVDQAGHDSQYVIEVRAGKTTRVKSSPLP